MVETQTHLKPKDTFEVINNSLLNGEDTRVLNLLYQPIIGSNALVLYQHLQTNEEEYNKPTKHFWLQDLMDISINDLSLARKKLEAIGLFKTYVRQKDEGHHYIYMIQNVIKAKEFLSDDILSLLLLDKVGEKRFESLATLFLPRQVDVNEYVEITSKYTEVYHLSNERIVQSNELVNKTIIQSKQIPEAMIPNVDSKEFDWKFFVDQLSGYKIDEKFLTNELKKVVLTFHSLYGINELEMVEHIKYSLDYVTNQIDMKDFKHRVYKKYHKVNKPVESPTIKESNELISSQSIDRHQNDLKHQGFTKQEIDVIVSCERIAPLIFLKAVKEQKGGFVSNNERWTVENLKEQSPLPDEVINMLIHYSLVVLDNPSLNQNMVNAIANNWAQKKVFKASDALKQVKAFNDEKAKNTNKRVTKNNYSNKPVRKETLPDWAVETNKRKETPLSKDEQSLLDEQLKQFTQGGEQS